jgi:hypothetical protein
MDQNPGELLDFMSHAYTKFLRFDPHHARVLRIFKAIMEIPGPHTNPFFIGALAGPSL